MIPSVFSAPLPIADKEAQRLRAQAQASSSSSQAQGQAASGSSSQQGGSSNVRAAPAYSNNAESTMPVTSTSGPWFDPPATNPYLHFSTTGASALDPNAAPFVPQAHLQEWQTGNQDPQGPQAQNPPSYTHYYHHNQPQDQPKRRDG